MRKLLSAEDKNFKLEKLINMFCVCVFAIVVLGSLFSKLSAQNDNFGKTYVVMLSLFSTGIAFYLLKTTWESKKVFMDADFLYVSNLIKEIVINKSEILEVTESRGRRNTKRINVEIKNPTLFGRHFHFVPFDSGVSKAPSSVIKELESLIVCDRS